MGVDDKAPSAEGSCAILVPTSEGDVLIHVSDKDICVQYESTGNFCSLPAGFRDSWQHTCPSPASISSSPVQTPTPTSSPTSRTSAATEPPTPTSMTTLPSDSAAGIVFQPPPLITTVTVLGNVVRPASAESARTWLLVGLCMFLFVGVAFVLYWPGLEYLQRKCRESPPRRLTNAALLDNTDGIVYPGFGHDYDWPR